MAMKVEFLGGQSAYSDKAVNYMLAEFPEVTNHINPDSLEFWWD